GAGCGFREEHALGVGPAIALGGAGSNENRAGGAESDEFVGVHGQIAFAERAVIFEKVARYPMVFAGARHVADLLAEIAAEEFGAGFSGRTDVSNGETRIVGHGEECRLAITRVAFQANLFGVDGFIGFKIVEGAAGSPGPSAECAPIIELAGLTFVDETNDAFGEARTVVRLHTYWDEEGIAPAFGKNLLLPGGTF